MSQSVFSKASVLDFYGQPSAVASPPASTGRLYYNSTKNAFIGVDPAGTNLVLSGPSPLTAVGYPTLPSAKIIPISAAALASGENDLFTVPSGKRATIGYTIVNLSGGSLNATLQIKVSGSYVQTGALFAIGNNSSNIQTPFNTYPILEAGETFSVLTSGSGMTVFGFVFVYDNTEPVLSPKVVNLASGANTIYTCPAGKVAWITNVGGGNGIIRIFNATVSTRAYTWNIVPAGGSISAGNQLTQSLSVNTLSSSNALNGYAALNAGDKITLTSDGGVAGQLGYVLNLVEVPA